MSTAFGLFDASSAPGERNISTCVNCADAAKSCEASSESDPLPAAVSPVEMLPPFVNSSVCGFESVPPGDAVWLAPLRQTSVTCQPVCTPSCINGSTEVTLTRQIPLKSHCFMQPSTGVGAAAVARLEPANSAEAKATAANIIKTRRKAS